MSPTLRGIVFTVLGAALLTANDALTKWLSADYPVAQVWCLRALSATALVLVLVPRYGGLRCLRPSSWGWQSVRALTFVATTGLIVWGLSLLPLVEMEAIVFASPVFIALLSAPLLGERVSAHRWIGVAAGFVGIVLILKPGMGVFGAGGLVALAAAVTSALRDIVTRRLGSSEHPLAILNYSNAWVVIIGFAIAPWMGWTRVSAGDWGLLVLNGALNAGAHLLIIEALRVAEAAVVAPYRYTALLWSLPFSVILFAEVPDAFTVLGALLVVACGLYILRHERRAARDAARRSVGAPDRAARSG